jgi:hypothetical protein
MNTIKKLSLFALIIIGFSSCLVHPRPYKKWYSRHGAHYTHGNNFWGRRFWVRQR